MLLLHRAKQSTTFRARNYTRLQTTCIRSRHIIFFLWTLNLAICDRQTSSSSQSLESLFAITYPSAAKTKVVTKNIEIFQKKKSAFLESDLIPKAKDAHQRHLSVVSLETMGISSNSLQKSQSKKISLTQALHSETTNTTFQTPLGALCRFFALQSHADTDKKSHKRLQSLCSLHPKRPEPAHYLGIYFLRSGEKTEGTSWILEAIKRNSLWTPSQNILQKIKAGYWQEAALEEEIK